MEVEVGASDWYCVALHVVSGVHVRSDVLVAGTD